MPARAPGQPRPPISQVSFLDDLQRYGAGILGTFDQASRAGSRGPLAPFAEDLERFYTGIDPATGRESPGLSPLWRRELQAGELQDIEASEGFVYDVGEIPPQGEYEFTTPRSMPIMDIVLPVPKGALGAGPALFSNAAKAIGKAKFKKGSAQQYLALPGLNKEEMEVTGLADWLAQHPGKSIDRGEVLEYMAQTEVRVVEVMKGGGDYVPGHVLPNTFEASDGLFYLRTMDGRELREHGGFSSYDEALEASEKLNEGPAPTKFSTWQLPGGENYRELLLTLPARQTGIKLPEHLRRNNFAREHGLNPDRVIQDASPEGQQWQAAIAKWRESQPKDFTAGHYDEPNVLAHIRMNDRVDAEGRKVLFIEEIQSDWHQAGRDKGYAGSKRDGQVQQDPNQLTDPDGVPIGGAWQILWGDGNHMGGFASRVEAEQALERYAGEGLVPDAPFKGYGWEKLAMKRAIRYAAENGYDRVAWTTGAQQVERYKEALRSKVDRIEWTKTDEGVHIKGYKGKLDPDVTNADMSDMMDWEGWDTITDDGIVTFTDGSSVGYGSRQAAEIELERSFLGHQPSRQEVEVVNTVEKENAVSDAIGKSMADKIKNDPAQSGVIEGDDITIDKTGMAAMYDKRMRNYANAIGKKYGAIAGRGEIWALHWLLI